MRTISLSGGKAVAYVDDEDYPRISQFRWYLNRKSDGRCYASRHKSKNTGTRYKTTTYKPQSSYSQMHQMILNTDSIVDHKDGDGLNNTRANLRKATPQQNGFNKKTYPGKQYKGVSYRKERGVYRAYIGIDNQYIHLGHFDTPTKAAHAYDKKALELFGEFACLNFPQREMNNDRAA